MTKLSEINTITQTPQGLWIPSQIKQQFVLDSFVELNVDFSKTQSSSY